MDNRCKYLKELESKLKMHENYWKILIAAIIVIILLIIGANSSNEIFWSALSAIGSIIAFAGVIYTIWYTENARIRQNEYEHKRGNLVEEQLKFKEQIMSILDIINPARVIEIIIRSDISDFQKTSQELNYHGLTIKNLNYKLYWYYNENINSQMSGSNTKLVQFSKEMNNFIKNIDECINSYTNELMPMCFEMELYNNFSEIIRLGGKLNEYDKKTYDNIVRKYSNGTIANAILQKRSDISIKLIDFSNANWNNFVELAKSVVVEREKIIEDILKSL